MLLFNCILILHIAAFLLFLFQLAVLFSKKEKILHKSAMFVGIAIACTGIGLLILKSPNINFYKVIPKSVLFVAISTFCGIYSGRNIPPRVYHSIIGMTVLASFIAAIKV